MDAFKRLKQIFPETDDDTTLVLLSPSTRIKIGKIPLQLAPYTIAEGHTVHAAYSADKNQIYLRLVDLENPFMPPAQHDKINKEISEEKTKEKEEKK
jgi:hypothetical protein